MRISSLRQGLLAGVSLGALLHIAVAQAESPPTNEELFRMLKAQEEIIRHQDRMIDRLEDRARRYERELGKTNLDGRATTSALVKTGKDLEDTRRALRQSQSVMATRADVDRTKAELGTQPTSMVFRTNPVVGWKGFAEFIYIRPSTTNVVAFEKFFNPPSAPDTDETVLVEHGFDPGFRAGVRYGFGNGWDVAFAYTFLRARSTATESTAAPDTLSLGGLENIGIGSGAMSYRLHYDAVDADLGYNFFMGAEKRIRAFGGLRWMRLDQSLKGSGAGISPSTGDSRAATIDASADLWAIGPRFGVSGRWDVGAGFFVFSHIAASFLIGSDKARLHTVFAEGPSSSNVFTQTRRSNTVFIQGLDGLIGAGYSWNWAPGMDLHVKLGYRIDHYFNVRGFGFGGGEGSSRGSESVTLHGFFLKAGITW